MNNVAAVGETDANNVSQGSDDNSQLSSGDAANQWIFPGKLPRSAKPGSSPADDDDGDDGELIVCDLVVYRDLSSAEADKLVAKLEREGIPTRLVQSPDASNPASYQLLVPRELESQTKAVIDDSRDDEQDDVADSEFELDRIARRIANYVCPLCNKQTLRALPPGRAWRVAWRVSKFLMLVLLVLITVLIASNDAMEKEFDSILSARWIGAAAIAAALLGLAYLVADRPRQCEKCGWTTGDPIGGSPAHPMEQS